MTSKEMGGGAERWVAHFLCWVAMQEDGWISRNDGCLSKQGGGWLSRELGS